MACVALDTDRGEPFTIHTNSDRLSSSIVGTRPLFRPSLFGGLALLPHERRRHVDSCWTRMLLRNVRGEAICRHLLTAEPAQGLPR
jgi:hypothetical protein